MQKRGIITPLPVRFKSEEALVSKYVTTLSINRDLVIFRELDSPNGVADIVYFSEHSQSRRAPSIGDIAPRWAFALKTLPYRKLFTIALFQQLAGVARPTALNILKSFDKAGFCVPGKKLGTWIKVASPTPRATNIVAVEAKLRDWKKALAQAYRYQDYASQAWVLLDAAFASSALKQLPHFKRLNVGLLTLNTEGTLKVFNKPQKRRPRSIIRYWHIQCQLRKLSF